VTKPDLPGQEVGRGLRQTRGRWRGRQAVGGLVERPVAPEATTKYTPRRRAPMASRVECTAGDGLGHVQSWFGRERLLDDDTARGVTDEEEVLTSSRS